MVGALDFGGTHVTAALVDPSAGVVLTEGRNRRPIEANAPAGELIATLVAAAASVLDRAGSGWLGVAIPGPFDYATGIGRFEGVAKFEALNGVDVGKALLSGLAPSLSRVTFINDASAFALGEWACGVEEGDARVVGITLGTGVGSGFVDAGRVIEDDLRVPPHGSVHLLEVDGRPLEDVVSRRALIRQARQAINSTSPDLDVLEIAAIARAGDKRAQDILDKAFGALGRAITPWLVAFDASMLVFGGSMTASWDMIEPPLLAAIRSVSALDGLAVRVASSPEDSALIGAAVSAAPPGGRVASRRLLGDM